MTHLRAVQVLCAVDEAGSFSAAARALGLTQSAVSQHVAALERACGTALVERAARPVALTEAGLVLVRHGRGLLVRVRDVEDELAELSGRRATRLRLGSFPTALATFVPAALRLFRDQRPDVVLSIVDDHLQRLLPRLAEGELDLALAYAGPSGRELAGLDVVPLLDDDFQLVLPVHHRLASEEGPVHLRELRAEAWVGGSRSSTWWALVRHACRTAGFDPAPGYTSDDHLAVQAFVAAGLGVAVVPGLAAARLLPGVRRRSLVDAPSRRIVAVHAPDRFAPPAAALMLDALTRTAGRLGVD